MDTLILAKIVLVLFPIVVLLDLLKLRIQWWREDAPRRKAERKRTAENLKCAGDQRRKAYEILAILQKNKKPK